MAKKNSKTAAISGAKAKGKVKVTAETVFRHLRLTNVRLVSVEASLKIVDSKLPLHAEIKMQPNAGATPSGDRINANVILELTARPEGETGDDCSTVKINAHYQCVYEVHDAPIEQITPQGEQIANVVTLVAWPYLRELCHSITSRMGIPGFTLPMYTPAQASSQGLAEVEASMRKAKKGKP